MDMQGKKQWESIKETIERIGNDILRGTGRMRDKVMVINYCLKATVLYRMQYCTWSLGQYMELDRALNKLLRKVTKNMRNFPAELIHADHKHGGLGLRSLSDEANERKYKMLNEGIHGEDMTAFAYSGIMGRAHRAAGRGGLEDTEMRVETTIGDAIWITSVVEWMAEMRLHIKTCGRAREPEMALDRRSDRKDRIDMNRRGIVTRQEGDGGVAGGEVVLRVGQVWKDGEGPP